MIVDIIPMGKYGYYRAEIFLGDGTEEDPDSYYGYCAGFCAAGCLYDGVISGFDSQEDATNYALEVRLEEYDWSDEDEESQ